MKQPKYVLKNPDRLRETITKRHGWYTIIDMAAGVGLSYPYLSQIFGGNPTGYKAMTKLANAAGLELFDIADFAKG